MAVKRLAGAIKTMKRQGLGILLSEQNSRSIAELAKRTYILNEGEVVFEGTCEMFFENEELVKKYLLV